MAGLLLIISTENVSVLLGLCRPTTKNEEQGGLRLRIFLRKSKKREVVFRLLLLLFVELVGFEPTSKQANHTLSTRLFRPSFFELQQDPDHQLQPYPLNFICQSRH